MVLRFCDSQNLGFFRREVLKPASGAILARGASFRYNDDAYNLTPAFILETVGAALALFLQKFEKRKKAGGWSEWEPKANVSLNPKMHSCSECKNITDPKARWIHDFLDWPPMRVRDALAQLHAIDEGKLSKQAVEELPTIHAAFHKADIAGTDHR